MNRARLIATLLLGLAACQGSGSAPPQTGGAGSDGSAGGGGASGTGGVAGASQPDADASADASDASPSLGDAAVETGDASSDVGDVAAAEVADANADAVDAPRDASAGDADAAASAAYAPCPTTGACRVMPLGDSITDGCCGENTVSMGAGYRLELFRLALAHHKNITFVGSHATGPAQVEGVAFPRQQEGHPGWTIADGGGRSGLQQQLAGWLAATPPDIVTLMIGTNDVDIQLDLANAPKRLGILLDTLTKTAPKALVVVAQIVPTRVDATNERVRAYNAAMPALVKTFADAGKHVVLVDQYAAFTKDPAWKTKLLANDLHPADAGYAAMANVWWAAIADLPAARP
jgi:lysophospholipase L1-like esterase